MITEDVKGHYRYRKDGTRYWVKGHTRGNEKTPIKPKPKPKQKKEESIVEYNNKKQARADKLESWFSDNFHHLSLNAIQDIVTHYILDSPDTLEDYLYDNYDQLGDNDIERIIRKKESVIKTTPIRRKQPIAKKEKKKKKNIDERLILDPEAHRKYQKRQKKKKNIDMNTHDQNQMEVVKTTNNNNNDQEVIEPGFYNIDGKLHQIEENGDMYELDFDINKNSIKNKTEEKSEMKRENSTSDLKDDPRWAETSQTKIDGSVAMMEARISKCMEETGRSYEECSKEVKKKMKSKTGYSINTEDTEEKKEESEEEEEDTEEEVDYVEICSKELDMLKTKAEELEVLKAEKDSLKEDFTKYESLFNEIKAERDSEIEQKRIDKIKQLSNDFDIPEDELKDDDMPELLKTERRLDMAIKRETFEEEIDPSIEKVEDMANDLKNRYFMEV